METVETLHVTALGAQGDGLAGGRVAVPGALPGEVVRGVVSGGRMEAPEILEPSPERIVPACPHVAACGGCAVQHASDALLARWKAGMVAKALRRAGLAHRIERVVVSPPGSRRRAAFAAVRGPVVGFHARRSGQVLAVPGCKVLAPALVAALPALERLAALGLRRGEGRFLVTLTEGGPDVAAEAVTEPSRDLLTQAAALAAEAGFARLTWNGASVATFRPPAVAFGRARVTLPPGAFLQATASGEAALVRAVRGVLAGAARVADLFAGCGTFALPLAEGAEVHAVESDGAAVEALLAGWRGASGLRRVTAERRDLYRRPLPADELARFDGVAIDPPRAGAEAQVRALAGSAVPRIAMVSCNPATFARDAATLVAAGFAMGPVTVVDQFRWSPHAELVAGFTRG